MSSLELWSFNLFLTFSILHVCWYTVFSCLSGTLWSSGSTYWIPPGTQSWVQQTLYSVVVLNFFLVCESPLNGASQNVFRLWLPYVAFLEWKKRGGKISAIATKCHCKHILGNYENVYFSTHQKVKSLITSFEWNNSACPSLIWKTTHFTQ